MKLYEIPHEIEALVNEETGEITDIELFTQLQEEQEQKLANVALWTKNNDSDVEALKQEARNLLDRAKTIENKNNNLKEFLKQYMISNGIEKIETPRVVVSFRKSSSLIVDDENELIKYCKDNGLDNLYEEKVVTSVKKNEVKKYVKETPIGVAHIDEKKNIQIK